MGFSDFISLGAQLGAGLLQRQQYGQPMRAQDFLSIIPSMINTATRSYGIVPGTTATFTGAPIPGLTGYPTTIPGLPLGGAIPGLPMSGGMPGLPGALASMVAGIFGNTAPVSNPWGGASSLLLPTGSTPRTLVEWTNYYAAADGRAGANAVELKNALAGQLSLYGLNSETASFAQILQATGLHAYAAHIQLALAQNASDLVGLNDIDKVSYVLTKGLTGSYNGVVDLAQLASLISSAAGVNAFSPASMLGATSLATPNFANIASLLNTGTGLPDLTSLLGLTGLNSNSSVNPLAGTPFANLLNVGNTTSADPRQALLSALLAQNTTSVDPRQALLNALLMQNTAANPLTGTPYAHLLSGITGNTALTDPRLALLNALLTQNTVTADPRQALLNALFGQNTVSADPRQALLNALQLSQNTTANPLAGTPYASLFSDIAGNTAVTDPRQTLLNNLLTQNTTANPLAGTPYAHLFSGITGNTASTDPRQALLNALLTQNTAVNPLEQLIRSLGLNLPGLPVGTSPLTQSLLPQQRYAPTPLSPALETAVVALSGNLQGRDGIAGSISLLDLKSRLEEMVTPRNPATGLPDPVNGVKEIATPMDVFQTVPRDYQLSRLRPSHLPATATAEEVALYLMELMTGSDSPASPIIMRTVDTNALRLMYAIGQDLGSTDPNKAAAAKLALDNARSRGGIGAVINAGVPLAGTGGTVTGEPAGKSRDEIRTIFMQWSNWDQQVAYPDPATQGPGLSRNDLKAYLYFNTLAAGAQRLPTKEEVAAFTLDAPKLQTALASSKMAFDQAEFNTFINGEYKTLNPTATFTDQVLDYFIQRNKRSEAVEITTGGVPGQVAGTKTKVYTLNEQDFVNAWVVQTPPCTTCGPTPPPPVPGIRLSPLPLLPRPQPQQTEIRYVPVPGPERVVERIVEKYIPAPPAPINNTNTQSQNQSQNVKVEIIYPEDKPAKVEPKERKPAPKPLEKLTEGPLFTILGDPHVFEGANTSSDWDMMQTTNFNIKTSDGKFIPLTVEAKAFGSKTFPTGMRIPLAGGKALLISGIANDLKNTQRDGKLTAKIEQFDVSKGSSIFGAFTEVFEDPANGFSTAAKAGENVTTAWAQAQEANGAEAASAFNKDAAFELASEPKFEMVGGKGQLTIELKQGGNVYRLIINENIVDTGGMQAGGKVLKNQTRISFERVTAAEVKAAEAPASEEADADAPAEASRKRPQVKVTATGTDGQPKDVEVSEVRRGSKSSKASSEASETDETVHDHK